MTRRLNVAPEVAEAMPTAYLAQLQAVVDDPDNRCARCHEPITGATVEAVILRDDNVSTVRLAHPGCVRSGIYQAPGMRTAITARINDPDGVDINTTLGRRPNPSPRALVFLEPVMLLSLAPPGDQSADIEDPLAVYAAERGLEPITGRLDQLTPEPTSTSRLHVEPDGLVLTNPDGHDTIPADPDVLADWCQTARDDHGTAIVICARGLGLTQQPPTIAEAIATRPAWAAQVDVDGLPQPHRRWRWPRPIKRKHPMK